MKILFSGGGTGGHINPAIAVAKYIKGRHPKADIRFAGAKNGMETRLVPREGFVLYEFEISGLSRKFTPKGIIRNARVVKNTLSSFPKAREILKEFAPDAVVGTGGYASFPIVREAARLNIPTAILEVNALPGVATKMLSKKVCRVMVSYQDTAGFLPDRVRGKIVLCGNPVREEIIFAKPKAAREKYGYDGRPVVLSFWGSLGAREMNRAIADFIKLETEKRDFYHVHATGTFGFSWMPEHVRKLGVNLSAHPEITLTEYIYDMADRMALSDIVICRAGASTLSEVCALGKPSIIVPSPNVAENHQEKNARALERAGAAVVILEKECTGARLYETVLTLLSDKERLLEMGANAVRMAALDANDRIYEVIRSIIKEKST